MTQDNPEEDWLLQYVTKSSTKEGKKQPTIDNDKKQKTLYCSFCGKSQHEVIKLIVGPSVMICNECINLSNDILEDELEGSSKIKRSITFSAEHVQAGIAILANFSRVVNQKYPNIPVSVSIEQVGLTVFLIIKTPTGEMDRVQETLDNYGMVLCGDMSVSALLDDPLHAHELKNKLEISALELRMTKELHHQAKLLHGERINSLESQVQHLHSLIGAGLSQSKDIHNLLSLLIKHHSQDTVIESAVACLVRSLSANMTPKDPSQVLDALKTIEKHDSKLFDSIKEILKDVITGVSTDVTTGWLGAIINSLPK